MNIDTAFPSKYLKASDLPEGAPLPFVIADITTEEIGKEKQVKPVIYFRGQEKGFVANKTNCNTIAKVLGSRDTDDWKGKTIRLYSTEVEFGGEMVESIRVKLSKNADIVKNFKPLPKGNQGPDDPSEDPDSIPFE